MRLLIIFLFPVMGTIFPMLAPSVLAQVPEPVGTSGGKIAVASYLGGEFCDHTTIGDLRVEGVKAILTELSTGDVDEWISSANGTFVPTPPAPGLISYEAILPDRYYTDAYLSNPVSALTTFDLVKLQQLRLNIANMCPFTRLSGDMNRDGQIDQADVDLISQLLLGIIGTPSNPYPYDHWVIMPKLTTIPNQQHPDLPYLTDFWNNAPVQNSTVLYPFVADLDVLGNHYEYEDNDCDWKGKVKKWDLTDEVECCFGNAFDIHVGKSGDLNTSIDTCALNGVCVEPFEIICNTSDDERYFDIIPYKGGFAAVGTANTQTPGYWQGALVVRMNKYGEIIWSKTFGGRLRDAGYSIDETADGNLFIAGSTNGSTPGSPNPREDVYILKIDEDGEFLFDKAFEGTDHNKSFNGAYGRGTPTSDGGYMLGGYTSNYQSPGWRSFYAIKVDQLGELEWSKAIGGNNNDWVSSVIELADGGFLFTGNTASSGFTSGYHDILVVKTDASGNVIWTRGFGSTYNDSGSGAVELSNGDILITGSFGTTSGFNNLKSKAVVIKINSSGTVLWTKSYSAGTTGRDHAYRTIVTDSGYTIIARSNNLSGNGLYDAILFKTDFDGNLLWTKRYGDDNKDDYLVSSHKISDTTFIFAGFNRLSGGDWDMFLQRTDENGNVYNHCAQESPTLVVQNETTLVKSPTANSVDVNQSSEAFTFIHDYEVPCYQYCALATPPVAARNSNNNSARSIRVANRNNSAKKGVLKKIQIGVQSDFPIDGFGFELNIDPEKFAITKINEKANEWMEFKTNATKENLAAGQLKILSYTGFDQSFEPMRCANPTTIIELEGKFSGDENDLMSICQIARGNLPMEFISEEKILSRDQYRLFINWAE